MILTYCKTDSCRKYANLNQDGYCPRCQSSDTNVLDETISNCGICKLAINDEESKSIGCDGCGTWSHAECAGPPALINLISISTAENHSSDKPLLGMLLWFCPNCSAEVQLKIFRSVI